jgi:cytochrome c553
VRSIPIIVAALSATLGATPAAGQGSDPNLGRNLAATCANCHGTNGVSVGEVDSLAGKPKDEIARKMQDFKTGARPALIMHQLAKGYTDEQIQLVAGWFAAQKPAK